MYILYYICCLENIHLMISKLSQCINYWFWYFYNTMCKVSKVLVLHLSGIEHLACGRIRGIGKLPHSLAWFQCISVPCTWCFKYIIFYLEGHETEKAMAPHSSTFAWKIPWTEEPGRLQSMVSRRVEHDRATSLSLFTFMHWRRKWQPTLVFLPGESHGQRSLSMGSHRVGHDWSDLAAAAAAGHESNIYVKNFKSIMWEAATWIHF